MISQFRLINASSSLVEAAEEDDDGFGGIIVDYRLVLPILKEEDLSLKLSKTEASYSDCFFLNKSEKILFFYPEDANYSFISHLSYSTI